MTQEIKAPVPPKHGAEFESHVVTTTSQATTNTKDKIVYIAAADETPVASYIPPATNWTSHCR